MADATKSIIAKIEQIAEIKKKLKVAINNAGGDLSETAPFSDYPDAIATIKNATFKILDKNMNVINITSNGQQTFSVKDDPGFAFTDGIPDSHKGWNSFTFNVNVESGSGSGGSGSGGGGSSSGGSGGSGSGSVGDYDGDETVGKIAVIFKFPDADSTEKSATRTVDYGKAVSNAPKPTRKGYKLTGWDPDPVGVGVSVEMTEWDSSAEGYVEGTDGYIICNAVWQSNTGEILEDWDYIGTHSHEYDIGRWKTLNIGKRMALRQTVDWLNNSGGVTVGAAQQPDILQAGSVKCIKICNSDSNGYSVWLPAGLLGYYPIMKCDKGTVFDPEISGKFPEVKNYGDTDICKYMNTTIFNALDDMLQPHIVATTKKHAGFQTKSGAKGIVEASGLKLWPLSYSEFVQQTTSDEGKPETYYSIPELVVMSYGVGYGNGVNSALFRTMTSPGYFVGSNSYAQIGSVRVVESINCHGVFCLK